jgi:hypothetical protein
MRLEPELKNLQPLGREFVLGIDSVTGIPVPPMPTDFSDTVSVDPTLLTCSSLTLDDLDYTGFAAPTRVAFDSQILASAEGVLNYGNWAWPKLDSLNVYVDGLESQVLDLRSQLFDTYRRQNFAMFRSCLDTYSADEFEDLYDQAVQLGVETSRLRRARRMAEWNEATACQFLVREIQNALAEKIAHLRGRIRVARALKAKLLRLFAVVYKFRNQIILQRRYYLAHGAHPIEGRFNPGDRIIRLLEGASRSSIRNV